MGWDDPTFDGPGFLIEPPLQQRHAAYLKVFCEMRHMCYDVQKLQQLQLQSKDNDPLREAVGLPLGPQGCYYTGKADQCITDNNSPASVLPGLWNQWEIVDSRMHWNNGEKFYHHNEWLQVMLLHFLIPWGYTVNGYCSWNGWHDAGWYSIWNNEMYVMGCSRIGGPDVIPDRPYPPYGLWDPERHKLFSDEVQQQILYMLLCMQRGPVLSRLPKPVALEICSYIATRDDGPLMAQ